MSTHPLPPRLVLLLALGTPLAGQPSPGPLPAPARAYLGLLLGSQHTEGAWASAGETRTFDRGTASVVVGATFGRAWGGEVGIHYLGDFPAGDAAGYPDWFRQVRGISAVGTLRLPLGRRAALVPQAGALFWVSDSRSHGNWGIYTDARDPQRSGTALLTGLALDLDLGVRWGLRLEAGRADKVLSGRMTRLSAGALLRF